MSKVAINTMNEAVDIYCKEGKILDAAKIKAGIAELYETQKKPDLAAKAYQQSYDFYEMEGVHNRFKFFAKSILINECYFVVKAIKILRKQLIS